MTDRIHTEEEPGNVLRQHFPNSSSSKIKKHAEKIYDRFDTSQALESIERSNVKPKRDIENLVRAAKSLRSATAKLSGVGWHGGGALVHALEDYRKNDIPATSTSTTPGVSKTEAANVFCAEIEAIAVALSDAAERVNGDAPSVLEPFGKNYKTGSRKKTAAFYTAKKCYKTYKKTFEGATEPHYRVCRK